MEHGYSDERNVQILIALLKANGIRKVIASPGTANVSFLGSIQYDSWFEIYSSVDERSAAYIACGLAYESGETVCLSCTGATAARNYMSGLTEAFYRKLPVLAITGSQPSGRLGHHIPQNTDRSNPPSDVVKLSVTVPIIATEEDEWECEVKVNRALIELKRHGGGPVHINLPNNHSTNFTVKTLPPVRKIEYFTRTDVLPTLYNGKIAIFIGSHKKIDATFQQVIDQFCHKYNAVVFCDHTSGYSGEYRVQGSLVAGQMQTVKDSPDLIINIGEISGDYYSYVFAQKNVWRVSEDGELRDTFHHLRKIFEMPEIEFFRYYLTQNENTRENEHDSYRDYWKREVSRIREKIPELPFSNIWIAQHTAHRIPNNSVIHFSILNSLRSWNFFDLPSTVQSMCNVGGFGIDGCMSSLIGASFANKEKLNFMIIGDLAFFYDLNSLGNRHIGNNIRIMLINNGKGTEFRNFNHMAYQFGEDADKFMAAGGHYGNKSSSLVKNYALDLGYKYLRASTKDEFTKVVDQFLNDKNCESPIVFEVFTDSDDESNALQTIINLDVDAKAVVKATVKSAIKGIAGDKGIAFARQVLKKRED